MAPRNPLPDLLEADDVKVPHDVDAKETAGDGADERVEVRVPIGEQAETPLELRPRRQFVRVREQQSGALIGDRRSKLQGHVLKSIPGRVGLLAMDLVGARQRPTTQVCEM
ncbi:MAG: hypothetical protein CK533_00895 [Acidobacterium sp.]|nr:MAG: hypothetical protein CK533_00895 [Acidobacterium sp.]